MNHIPQTAPYGDCIVSAIAMYCDVSYERVMQSVAPDVIPEGMWYAEVLHAIEKITRETSSLTSYLNQQIKQVSQFEFPKEKAIYGVLRAELGYTFHYVCCDGENFYDPLLPESITLKQAKTDYHSGWLVVAMIKRP
jgi:hypothetical protein